MSHFPATHSILCSDHLSSFLDEKYLFKGIVYCKLLKTWVNDTYLITSGLERFIFRVYRYGWRNKEEVQAELDVILLLKKKGISLSFPIADKTGDYIQSFDAIEGTRFGVLFSFANGEKPTTNSNELEFSVGKYMGNIHQYTAGLKVDRINYTAEVLLDDAIEKIRVRLPLRSEEFFFLKKFQQYFYKEIITLNVESFRRGVVHLDVWRDNFHLDNNKQITLFDFDFCGNGWLLLDLAFHAIVTFITEPNLEKYEVEMDNFYKGYENVIPISKEERNAIPLLATVTLIYYLSVQSERFAAIYANEEYIKLVINQRIKRWVLYCELFD